VVGVEEDASSVACARRNADRWKLGNCRFIQQNAATAARGLAAGGESFSLVVLDPPRSGAADVLDPVAALAAEADRLRFVQPGDARPRPRRLVAQGFALGPIQPLDLFPQTYHVETVARLTKARSAHR